MNKTLIFFKIWDFLKKNKDWSCIYWDRNEVNDTFIFFKILPLESYPLGIFYHQNSSFYMVRICAVIFFNILYIFKSQMNIQFFEAIKSYMAQVLVSMEGVSLAHSSILFQKVSSLLIKKNWELGLTHLKDI